MCLLVLVLGVEMCILYNVDEETLAETWMAYSVTNCSGEPPTVETITQMERKVLVKQDISLNTPMSRKPTTPLMVYNSNTSTSSRYPLVIIEGIYYFSGIYNLFKRRSLYIFHHSIHVKFIY